MSCTGECGRGSCSHDVEDAPSCATPSHGIDYKHAQYAPHALVSGVASGPVLYSSTGLSFWGGVDPETGIVVDVHHPLHGRSLAGQILAIPSGRGSCSGSLGLLELLVAGCGPKAILLEHPDAILALGAMIGARIFDVSIPVIALGAKFALLADAVSATVTSHLVNVVLKERTRAIPLKSPKTVLVELSEKDLAVLRGEAGEARRVALELVIAMAEQYGAASLLPVSGAHIDACIYVGPATLRFAEHFAAMGARFAVPTTLNAISVDAHRWKALGVPESEANPAVALMRAYESMGASESLTCAPYLLPSAPGLGDNVAWAESNAVVFANSVLGARTIKFPDMLDVLVALTGRAPKAGPYLDAKRVSTLGVRVPSLSVGRAEESDGDALWPLLGYAIGHLAENKVTMVYGLEDRFPSRDDLKAFAAAYGTTSASAMFHIAGITPEAHLHPPLPTLELTLADLRSAWDELNSASPSHSEPPETRHVGLVALGNPHLSTSELSHLATLTRGQKARIPMILTCGRHVAAQGADTVRELEAFGATLVTDTCWCMIREPVIPPEARVIATNSAKYAHYGPGGVGRKMWFGSVQECVEAAVTGRWAGAVPGWLEVV